MQVEVEETVVMSIAILLSLVYLLFGFYHSYNTWGRDKHKAFEFIDLDIQAYGDSHSCRIEPIQVYRQGSKLNVSLLGLCVNSEIMITKLTGEVVYLAKTDKCYGRISFETSKWKKGYYLFCYAEATESPEEKKYISGVFEV